MIYFSMSWVEGKFFPHHIKRTFASLDIHYVSWVPLGQLIKTGKRCKIFLSLALLQREAEITQSRYCSVKRKQTDLGDLLTTLLPLNLNHVMTYLEGKKYLVYSLPRALN